MLFGAVQNLALLALSLVTLVAGAFAFVDCLRRPHAAFPAVSRQTKTLWLVLTGAATLVSLGALTGLLPVSMVGLVGIAAIVITMVYLVDVRPRIIDITSPRW
jgi:hypothetical protein